MFYGVNFAPYDLYPDGPRPWDTRKDETADRALAEYRKFYTNLTDNTVTDRLIRSPIDHAGRPSPKPRWRRSSTRMTGNSWRSASWNAMAIRW